MYPFYTFSFNEVYNVEKLKPNRKILKRKLKTISTSEKIDLLYATTVFLYSLKTLEKSWFSDVFRDTEGDQGMKWVNIKCSFIAG